MPKAAAEVEVVEVTYTTIVPPSYMVRREILTDLKTKAKSDFVIVTFFHPGEVEATEVALDPMFAFDLSIALNKALQRSKS